MQGPSYYKSTITTKMAMDCYDAGMRQMFIGALAKICIAAAELLVVSAAIKILFFS